MPVDNVLISDPDNERLHIFAKFGRRVKAGMEGLSIAGGDISAAFNVSGGPAAVLPMQLNTDALTDLVLLRKGSASVTVMATVPQATASVTNNSNGGPGSLRDAIENANRTPGLDTINFNIQGGGTQVISLINQLPEITDAVVIDGSTQPGGRVVLEGTGAGFGAEGLVVRGGNSRIRGLVFNNYISGSNGQGGDGIVLLTNGGNVVEGNIVGLNSTGTAARGNSFGVYVINSSNNVIGGTAPEARNIISGNKGWGVILWEKAEFLSAGHTTGNAVRGNYIGTDITGAVGIGNGGLDIRLGLDLTGSVFLNNTIGGTTAGARNVISGSGKDVGGSAVYISGRTVTGALVQGNYIGTNAAGNAALPNNGNGVQMLLATGNTIGGTAPGAGNVVAASTFPGIALGSFPEGIQNVVPTSNNLIQGNFVGTNAAGTAALGNTVGIIIGGFIAADLVLATDNTVGGAVAGARNVISGNKGNGLMFINNGSRRNVAMGNFIGTNAAGTAALGNEGSGVFVTQALEVTIGGSSPESRNVISGNLVHGVAVGIPSFGLAGGTGVRIEGNSIGTNADGSLDLGNQLDGIFLDAKSVDNSIENNLIAFNKRNGIFIPNNSDSGKQIKILGNLIFANAQLGIDLGAPGVTPNDPLDLDGGANEQQNFPVVGDVSANAPGVPDLAGAIRTNAVTLNVPVSLNSAPNTPFILDFYVARTCNQTGFTLAPERIGTRQMRTDGAGNANETFAFTLDRVPIGFLKVTATDPRGNTSEMSDQCKAITVNGSGGSCTIACPPNITVAATSASGAVVNYQAPTLSGTCANVIIETSLRSGSTFPIGTTTVTATARDGSGVRGTCSFTVTVTPLNGPRIDRVEKQGKKLLVFGSGFSGGAVILINNQSQKTSNDLFNPTTSLIGKKAGKKIKTGDVVRVRNADGTLTPPFTYPNNGG
ncbi:MAG TPA: HYR domain-containing protein [Blastocatellia bacterium]|nr:HYR domain-containing protein [Blastocatellia bacterium]